MIFTPAQVRGFAEQRRQQAHAEAHRMTPRERIAEASRMREAFRDPAIPGSVRPTDEPAELWLRILEHLRRCP